MALRNVGKVDLGSRMREARAKYGMRAGAPRLALAAPDDDVEDAYVAGFNDALTQQGVGGLSARDAYVSGFLSALNDESGLVVHHEIELEPGLREQLEAIRLQLKNRKPWVPLGAGVLGGLILALIVYLAVRKLSGAED